mgnify:CR=1 FL=1
MRVRSRRRIGLAARTSVGGGLLAATALAPGLGHADPAPRPFQGSAESSGANVATSVPGFPVSNNPVDSGGPVAQANLNSLGTSEGFASFPDPGSVITSLPGLGAGLLSGGLAGLPPIDVPQAPSYPFEISSDAGTNPHQSAGAGPYNLAADSSLAFSQASATAGLQTGVIGNAALVTSKARVSVQGDGGVVATAVSDVQSLTIGPLTIGEVKSTATETLGPDGTIEPTTAMVIDGVAIGGLAVGISPTGLDLPGPTYPLPLNATLASLLSAAKISVTVLAAQSYPGRVVAPALRITGPVSVKNVGSGPGSYTLTIGGASAAMLTSGLAEAPATPVGARADSPVGPSAATGATAPITVPPLPPAGSAAGVQQGATPTPPSALSPVQAGSPSQTAVALGPESARPLAVRDDFDITSLYLIVAVMAVVMWAAGQLIRLLGVRGTWT